ncbi:NifU protein homolog [hydrothermal vent metagenome]|uniref:NifU protein homolog n=1 Tax=hydrothermal vent metagenome TaxID=652676 RepID=A0A1W1EA60_9ZZZZ
MQFSDEDIYAAVKHHLPEVNEYIASHGGTIKLLGVKNGTVYVELAGNCHGCAMSLMTTKMVVQKRLRELIHPELTVVNVDGTPENVLPDDIYAEEQVDIDDEEIDEEISLWDKAKSIFTKES